MVEKLSRNNDRSHISNVDTGGEDLKKSLLDTFSLKFEGNRNIPWVAANKDKLFAAFLQHRDSGGESIASGSQGEVFTLPLDVEDAPSELLVIKKKKEGAMTEYNPHREYEYHQIAHGALSQSSIDGVGVPTPYAYISQDDDEYLLMEFVPGKSIFFRQSQKVIDELLSSYHMEIYMKNNDIVWSREGVQTDRDMVQKIKEFKKLSQESGDRRIAQYLRGKRMNGDGASMYWGSMLGLYNRLSVDRGDTMAIRDKQQGQLIKGHLKDCLEMWHDHGVYHNDLNPTNILYDDENKKLYIIDFGLAGDGDINKYNADHRVFHTTTLSKTVATH